jgi:hypothetical protein
MRNRHHIPLIMLVTVLIPACFTPVPQEDWPDRGDPLFRSVVWIHAPGAWGTGVIVHSSDRGTYVLTAAHVAADDDGYELADGEIEVGVWALTHTAELREPYATYQADVVASTAARAPTDEDPSPGIMAISDWMTGDDLAILRLRTALRFEAARLHAGSTEGIRDRPAIVVAVVPEMYPHRKSALLVADRFVCLESVDGNSGSPIFVDGRVVGLGTSKCLSPGPKLLHEFFRENEEIRFLLEEPGIVVPTGD